MAVITPATRITPALNRPFHHRSTLASLHCASKNFLFFGKPTPSSTSVAVRCQKPVSDGISSTNHVSSTASSSIDFLTLCHRLKVNKPHRLKHLSIHRHGLKMMKTTTITIAGVVLHNYLRRECRSDLFEDVRNAEGTDTDERVDDGNNEEEQPHGTQEQQRLLANNWRATIAENMWTDAMNMGS